MGIEIKFDIKSLKSKAETFNKDKDRTEKLKKKEGYLLFLCSGFEEILMFRAVYTELFPKDKETNDLLQKIIDKMIETADEINLLNFNSKNDIDELYKRFKIYARTALKNLQRQEIAMIERIRNKTREAERIEQAKKIRSHYARLNRNGINKNDYELNQGHSKTMSHTQRDRMPIGRERDSLRVRENSHNNHEKQQPKHSPLEAQVRRMHQRKLIGKIFEELSPELQQEIIRDREKRVEIKKKLPEMIQQIKREEKIKLAEKLKQPELKKEEIKTLSR